MYIGLRMMLYVIYTLRSSVNVQLNVVGLIGLLAPLRELHWRRYYGPSRASRFQRICW